MENLKYDFFVMSKSKIKKEKNIFKNIPVLIIDNYIQLDKLEECIKVTINGKSKVIELGDTNYQNKELNVTILEIKENKKNKIHFLEIDDAIYRNDSELYYIKEQIYIIQWKNMTDILLSFCEIKYIKKLDFIYTSQISSKSKFSLIFGLSNNKLIGKHESKLEHYNKGSLFKKIINIFIKKYNVDNNYKYNKFPNEINILIKINEKDINEKIYFLDNYSF